MPNAPTDSFEHPRLYCRRANLAALREARRDGLRAKIWQNIQESADWCLSRAPRRKWIAPISPDPIYENLYDRFYAIMGDLAITEHLAFAYALSGDSRYGDAAHQWILASCRVWYRETESLPDRSKAYAVCRLLKGVAVGYDLAYDRFAANEQEEIRHTLGSIGRKYYKNYFRIPAIAGPEFHKHHAVVEWASFGVTALTLLDEVSEAEEWLNATIQKFEEHLLPVGLADDGAQMEGATFWASTMQYRLFFMDALRHVTGRSLFGAYQSYMNADLALASVAAEKQPELDSDHANVVLEPSYGQLDYYAPVLLYLAREYRRSVCQRLALWDHSLGHIQRTRFVTPHGEQLLFELGGYAYLWYDPTVSTEPGTEKLSYHFPSVGEAYMRASWQPGDLLVGVRKGEIVVHAGEQAVLIEPKDWVEPSGDLSVQSLEDNGSIAVIRCGSAEKSLQTITLNRVRRQIQVHRRITGDWQWWCHGDPVFENGMLIWGKDLTLSLQAGTFAAWNPKGYSQSLAVGYGKLYLEDPTPRRFGLATIRPNTDGEVLIEVQV